MVRGEHEDDVHGPVSLGELPVKKKGRRGYVSLLPPRRAKNVTS